MARFIELTYFKRNTYYPEDSEGTHKRFLLNVDDVSTITPYEKSTKIRHKYTGDNVEVCETLDEIKERLKGG